MRLQSYLLLGYRSFEAQTIAGSHSGQFDDAIDVAIWMEMSGSPM